MAIGPRRLTLLLVNLAGIMEHADTALLPAVYMEVGAALHASPSRLGLLTLLRSMVQTCCYPLAAYVASRHDRAQVISTGTFLWAAATFLVAISSNFFQVAVSRGLNGIGLALVLPSIRSLLADSTNGNNRGIAFGWLQLTGGVGSILGTMFSLHIAATSVVGIPGWRIAFLLVAVLSVMVGILVSLFAFDPHFSGEMDGTEYMRKKKHFKPNVKELIEEAKAVMKIPSFRVIVAQGVTGSVPGYAFSFLPMWLELVGFSHWVTGLLVGLFTVSGCFGGLFGGFMGDYMSSRYPNYGRIILAQISSGSTIPLATILLLALPGDTSAGFSHALVLAIMGFMNSWCAAATNNPMVAEIVPERSRTIIYALDRAFESLLASFAPPVIGLLAENIYGYRPLPKGANFDTKIGMDRENASSLAKSLYIVISISISLCFMIYSLLYCTYPRDRDRAQKDSLIASKLQPIEMDNRLVNKCYKRLDMQPKIYGDRESDEFEDGEEFSLYT